MAETRERMRDYPVPQNLFMYVRERTKGHVNTVVGPYKLSMSDTEDVVTWNATQKRFNVLDNPDAGIQVFVTAAEGEYIVLDNPTIQKAQHKHPIPGTSSNPQDLDMGKSIVIHGPVAFPLWPMQVAEVVGGHRMRSNQFLVVEIVDPKLAAAEWSLAVGEKRETKDEDSIFFVDPAKLSRGQRLVIRGTELSFFMPVTGMSVITDDEGKYVRDAVTLEQLEYCILLDENGAKDFPIGPKVVFPKPTQSFVRYKEDGSRVFRAMELTGTSGVHVKVTADYKEGDKTIKAGTELFITGKDTPIYFPRKEHAIIDYPTIGNDGDTRREKVHYASAVPEGHGRYVLNKERGCVETVVGPAMLLLNPAEKVMVQRVLTERQVSLWFPGNLAAMEFNRKLQADPALAAATANYSNSGYVSEAILDRDSGEGMRRRGFSSSPLRATGVGDSFNRPTNFTPPKTIQLDDRFTGAVSIKIFPGYAVQVVGRTGSRRVEVGPQTILLGYDEELTTLAMSTGKPKTTDRIFETAYLMINGNQVSDIITVSTSDDIKVNVKIAYQVTFEGDSGKWFNVSNYVKQICDFYRSLLRGIVKQHDIQTFNHNAVSIIRDAVLGAKPTDGGKRPGRLFDENNCRVYDCEILATDLTDSSIALMLAQNQAQVMQRTLAVAREETELSLTKRSETAKREIATEVAKTTEVVTKFDLAKQQNLEKLELAKLDTSAKLEEFKTKLTLSLSRLKTETEGLISLKRTELELERTRFTQTEADKNKIEAKKLELEMIEIQSQIDRVALETQLAKANQENEITQDKNAEQLRVAEANAAANNARLAAETEAVKARIAAITPDLAKALNNAGDNQALVKLAESLGIASYLKEDSLGAVINKVVDGTNLADAGRRLLNGSR